ncbi:MAG: hypothetical protein QM764_11540 [Chitinophagaceae bacterium]
MKNKTHPASVLAVAILVVTIFFAGCNHSNSTGQLRSLEDDITSLRKNVSSLEQSLGEMEGKNTALETKIKELEVQVNSLKISSH